MSTLRVHVLTNGNSRHIDHNKKSITIGRSEQNDFVFQGLGVSRQHLRVWWDSGAIWLEDLGSANGTWVDGKELIPRKPFRYQGESIRLAQAAEEFTFEFKLDARSALELAAEQSVPENLLEKITQFDAKNGRSMPISSAVQSDLSREVQELRSQWNIDVGHKINTTIQNETEEVKEILNLYQADLRDHSVDPRKQIRKIEEEIRAGTLEEVYAAKSRLETLESELRTSIENQFNHKRDEFLKLLHAKLKSSVDEFIHQTLDEKTLQSEHEQRIAAVLKAKEMQLTEEAEAWRADLRAQREGMLTAADTRLNEILKKTTEDAARTVAQASLSAQKMEKQAEAEARDYLLKQKQIADDTLKAAEQEAAQLLAEAENRAKRNEAKLELAARTEARSIVSEAEARAERITKDATMSARELYESSRKDADAIVQKANQDANDRIRAAELEAQKLIEEGKSLAEIERGNAAAQIEKLRARVDAEIAERWAHENAKVKEEREQQLARAQAAIDLEKAECAKTIESEKAKWQQHLIDAKAAWQNEQKELNAVLEHLKHTKEQNEREIKELEESREVKRNEAQQEQARYSAELSQAAAKLKVHQEQLAGLQQEVAAERANQQILADQYAELSQTLVAAQSEYTQLMNQIDQAKETARVQNAELREQHLGIQNEIAAATTELKSLRSEVDQFSERKSAQDRELEELKVMVTAELTELRTRALQDIMKQKDQHETWVRAEQEKVRHDQKLAHERWHQEKNALMAEAQRERDEILSECRQLRDRLVEEIEDERKQALSQIENAVTLKKQEEDERRQMIEREFEMRLKDQQRQIAEEHLKELEKAKRALKSQEAVFERRKREGLEQIFKSVEIRMVPIIKNRFANSSTETQEFLGTLNQVIEQVLVGKSDAQQGVEGVLTIDRAAQEKVSQYWRRIILTGASVGVVWVGHMLFPTVLPGLIQGLKNSIKNEQSQAERFAEKRTVAAANRPRYEPDIKDDVLKDSYVDNVLTTIQFVPNSLDSKYRKAWAYEVEKVILPDVIRIRESGRTAKLMALEKNLIEKLSEKANWINAEQPEPGIQEMREIEKAQVAQMIQVLSGEANYRRYLKARTDFWLEHFSAQ